MTTDVEIGFFSFSEVTDPSEHHAYNEWHQLDHLPEQYRLPGVVMGQRWVCTPACKAARPFDSEQLAPAQYVTLYLMSAPVEKTLEEFRALGSALHEEGRFHMHRRSCLSGPFALIGERAAERALVSARVLPFRPNLGVYVIVESLTPDFADATGEGAAGDATVAARLCAEPGVAGIWRFVALRGFERLGFDPGDRRVTVCYLDEPPLTVADGLGEAVREIWGGRPAPEHAGPFETITPWSWGWFDGP